MRILKETPREGRIRLVPESLDDLWELEHILSGGDRVRAHTERKVTVGGDRAKQVRKPMTLTISVTEATLEHDILRIQGTVEEGPEDYVSHGDHHSLSIEPGTELELTKEWDTLERERLERATKEEPLDILLVTFDREEAWIAELTRRGYKVVQTLTGDVAKKGPGSGDEDFWRTLADAVTQLDARREYRHIVAASPAFWTDYLLKALPQGVAQRTTAASCSAVGEAALQEVVRRPELAQVLSADRTSKDEQRVHALLEAIAKDKACYGRAECQEKASLGQISTLLVSHSLVRQSREEGWYGELDATLEQAKDTGAEVHLLEHAVGQLDALGGIAGVLRW